MSCTTVFTRRCWRFIDLASLAIEDLLNQIGSRAWHQSPGSRVKHLPSDLGLPSLCHDRDSRLSVLTSWLRQAHHTRMCILQHLGRLVMQKVAFSEHSLILDRFKSLNSVSVRLC